MSSPDPISESTGAGSDTPLTTKSLADTPASILALDKHLTLTITDEQLLITDEAVSKSYSRSCCGLSGTTTSRSIPLLNILSADLGESSITITFASGNKSAVKPASLTFPFTPSHRAAVETWTALLLSSAYGSGTIPLSRRLKVLVNPFGGKGHAIALFEKQARPIFEAARCVLDVETTEYSGHAIEIAEKLDIDAFDAIVCCSGDGLPHEVFNGLAKRGDARTALQKIAVCQLPGGSGNAMCWNLTGTGSASLAALSIIKSVRRPMDLVSVTQGKSRVMSFLSQAFGMVAEVDLGTEDQRWMGDARFTYGFLQRVYSQTVWPCDLAVKVAIEGKEEVRAHYREGNREVVNSESDTDAEKNEALPELCFGSINDPLPKDWEMVPHPTMGNFYAGNMAYMAPNANFFPASLPNEGMFDLMCVDGKVGRVQALKMLLAVETGGHFEMPSVLYRKVLGYRLIPHKREGVEEEYISIDGERIAFEPFQAEVHSGLGTVLARGEWWKAPGV